MSVLFDVISLENIREIEVIAHQCDAFLKTAASSYLFRYPIFVITGQFASIIESLS